MESTWQAATVPASSNAAPHARTRCDAHWRARLVGLLALVAALASAPVPATTARLWSRATPAAGVAIRSAANFRAVAVSTAGSVPIDLYALSSTGVATRLGSLIATPAGTASVGSYATGGAAAIYWQYATLPATSNSAPPVSVTFINDAPQVPLSSLYYPGLPQTPFASTDTSLLLDLDLRKGLPAGWAAGGSGTFDTTAGYTPGSGSGSGIYRTAIGAFSGSQAMPQGTVAVRLQRTGVATDNSFGKYFWDSTGNTLNATTQNRQILQAQSASGAWSLQLFIGAGTFPSLRVAAQTATMAQPSFYLWQTVNSHYVAGYQDPVYSDLVFTWFQNQYYVFFDGHLLNAGALGDVPVYQMFQNLCIGNQSVAGLPSGAPFGSYAIQRVQVSSRFLGPVVAGPRIGLLPDSFAAAYTQRSSPTPTGAGGTLLTTDVDAVQNALGLFDGMGARAINPGQTASFHQIQALMFRNYGFIPPIYDAGHPGHGYSSINAPIDDAYIAALNRAAPAIVMAGGTVNDVNVGVPSDGNLVADTLAVFNRLYAGGGARIAAPPNPSLEQIVYLETLSSQAVYTIIGAGPAYTTESQNIIALTRGNLGPLTKVGAVGFQYVTSHEWWDLAPTYTSYLYGSSPANPYNQPGGADYGNVHPDPTGYSVIAAHLYAPIAAAVLNSAGADLSLTGTAGAATSNGTTFQLRVANAGPLAAASTVVTTVVPANVTLVAAASSAGCTQSGNTISCAAGALAAGSSATFTLTLRTTTGVAPSTIAFAVGSTGANDPSVNNNAVTLKFAGAGVPASSSGDGPVPPWSMGALAATLYAAARRRLKKPVTDSAGP